MVHTVDLIDELAHELKKVTTVHLPFVVQAFVEHLNEVVLLDLVEYFGLLLGFVGEVLITRIIGSNVIQGEGVLSNRLF